MFVLASEIIHFQFGRILCHLRLEHARVH